MKRLEREMKQRASLFSRREDRGTFRVEIFFSRRSGIDLVFESFKIADPVGYWSDLPDKIIQANRKISFGRRRRLRFSLAKFTTLLNQTKGT